MTLKLGMCGFSMAMERYFATFPVVEIQTTFYDPPPERTLAKWRAQAPDSFEFTMKAWQVITHARTSSTYRRMRRPFDEQQRAEAGLFRLNETTLAAWEETLAAQRILRATAILFQCPASFRPTDENVEAMHRFITTIARPPGVRLLWEPRGKWPPNIVSRICHDLQLIHAVDPFVQSSLTPEMVYWRLHGNGSAYASFSDRELEQLLEWHSPHSPVEQYILFNNVPRTKDVHRFIELMRIRGVSMV